LNAAARLGWNVERSLSVYAAWDGERTLTLSDERDFDADDSLAQLIFHEICHALVAGPTRRKAHDWGLDNTSERDLVFEHACHRVQASLAQRFGLRDFFAVTTEWRDYWDALPLDPLAPSDDPALPLARRALTEAEQAPWADVLAEALAATASLAEIARRAAPADSLWHSTRALHVTGFVAHADAALRCDDCAWSYSRAKRRFCRQQERQSATPMPLAPELPACERWEPRLDGESCKTCGACCREGFDRVELKAREPLLKRHPELIQQDSFGTFIPRPGGRCLALEGGSASAPFRCRVYPERPRSCAEFAIGGASCLLARRRVGLSP
jgi:hypothetical protein